MPRNLQIINFEGGLNTDLTPDYIQKDYTDALDIQALTGNTESTLSTIPKLGNRFTDSLGSVSVQNKTWRLFISQQTAPHAGYLLFLDANGNYLNNPTPNPSPPLFNFATPPFYQWDMSLGFAAQVAAITSIITAGIPMIDPTATIVGTDTSGVDTAGYVDITFNGISGYDLGFFATHKAVSPGVTDARLPSLIVQEAYDVSLAGELNVIGSNDVLGDLYLWSTPQKNLVTTISPIITGITSVAGKYRITTSSAHGLVTGMSVEISGVVYTGTPPKSPNSIWIITVISPTVFDVQEFYTVTTGFVYTSGGVVTIYTEGVGEIGVMQNNSDADTWNYTRLLRTKEWNFRTKKQPHTYAERNSLRDSVYWTDDFNVPRVFYYSLPFIVDGALSINGGNYDYGSISEETKLILSSTSANIQFVQQVQGGGNIQSGNWRYAIRFLSDSLTPTEFSDVTNPVNAFVASTSGSAYLLIGDQPGVFTSKINELEITGIIAGLFKYVELAGINYVGDAVQGYIIKRELLSTNATSLTIQHTGNESDITDLDLGLLNQFSTPVLTAKNIDVVDSRMILSNLTTSDQTNFTDWAQTIFHSLYKKELPTVRSEMTPAGTMPNNLQVAEYQDPQNVNNFVGYMHNETYRIGIKGRFKETGEWSDVFWVDDITFDTLAYARRNTALVDFDLLNVYGSPFLNNRVYSTYFSLENIDIDAIVNGKKIRDWFDKLAVVRRECVPEILACGTTFLGISGWLNGGIIGSDSPIITSPPSTNTNDSYAAFIPYATASSGSMDVIIRPTVGSFYAPDIYFNNTSISFSSGDRILNHGAPVFAIAVPSLPSSFYQKTGTRTGTTSGGGANPFQDVALDDMQIIAKGGSAVIGGLTYQKFLYVDNTGIGGSLTTLDFVESPVLYYSGSFSNPTTSGFDFGLRYMQYFRPLVNKYGDITSGTYVTCGAIADIDATTAGVISIDVFGGDTFTQNVYFKNRMGDNEFNGWANGLSFYCQNRINAQMKTLAVGTTQDLYPGITTPVWLAAQTQNEDYQRGYNIKNEVQSDIAFNPNADFFSDLPTRIIWSELKPQGSSLDNYRAYLPLNFKDLDLSFGEIIHHANSNGELFTWQLRKFMRQYFNTRGTIDIQNSTDAVIGSGTVMGQDGLTVSTIGSKHKWSIIKGKSTGGNDVFYWINTELKKVVRFGYDGTVSISDIKGLQSFFANNLTWVDDKDTPADGIGICGVWNDRYAEVIWSVRGIRDKAQWDGITFYSAGDVVLDTPVTYSTFEQTGELYTALSPNFGTAPPTNPLVWSLIPHTNNNYYNEYSIILNEFKNKFTTFHTPKPKIYLKWKDSFLTPRPVSDVSRIYKHDEGIYLTWYDDGVTSQTSQGYIEGVINGDGDDVKWYEALQVQSDLVPKRIELKTSNGLISYLDDTEFETRENVHLAPIKEDSTVSVQNPLGLNNVNTSLLYGHWQKTKFIFDTATYQSLINIVCKYRISPRRFNK